MRNTLALYWRFIQLSMRAQLQYRASFIMLTLGSFIGIGVEFLGVLALFDRFGTLRGWTLAEVALFYGVIHASFAVAEASARGFDVFPAMVKSGDFDRVLLRPRTTTFQIAAKEMQLMRVGRLSIGAIALFWAVRSLAGLRSPLALLLIAETLAGAVCLFFGLFVVQGAMSFWTVETLELMNVLTYGGTETAQYPLAIFTAGFRRFFTWVVPFGLISYVPLSAALGRTSIASPLPWLAPIGGPVALAVAMRFWEYGVSRYRSTGS